MTTEHTETPNPDGLTTQAVIDQASEILSRGCQRCGAACCGHEAVMSIIFGYKNSPRCQSCLAQDMRESAEALMARLVPYLERRDCFRGAWFWAGEQEGFGATLQPSCMTVQAPASAAAPVSEPTARASQAEPTTSSLDAGDMSCGDLVLRLRQVLAGMRAGEILEVRATDSGAPHDIPAWCRLTRHRLLAAAHPVYRIARRDDPPTAT